MVNFEWGTPVAHYIWNDAEQLTKTVSDIIINFPNGIDNGEKPHIDEYPELESAHNFLDKCTKDFLSIHFPKQEKHSISWWIHVYREGFYHQLHNHAGSQFTGILYLAAPDEGGELVLHDPRYNANRGFNDNLRDMFKPVTIQPKAGDLYLFPSFVWHNVEPVKDLRICIPFDVWC